MPTDTYSVPVEHTSVSYDVSPRQSAPRRPSRDGSPQEELNLLDLIEAVGEVTEDETEIVATVIHMLESGRVRLCGDWNDLTEEHRAIA